MVPDGRRYPARIPDPVTEGHNLACPRCAYHVAGELPLYCSGCGADMEERTWGTAAGRKLRVQDIEDHHLQSIERFLLGRDEFPFRPGVYEEDEWRGTYLWIREEMDRRGMEPLEGDHPAAVARHQGGPRPSIEELRRRARELDEASYGGGR